MSRRAGLLLVLALMGAGWGVTQPLAKIAVSEGYRHFGLVFWQLAIGAVVLTAVQAVRRRPFRRDPTALFFYVLIATIGTVLPNAASYEAARHLPAGIVSILISTVPLMAFPLAIAMGNERFRLARLAGVACGFAGILLIAGPETALPDPAMAAFLPIALIAPAFYAVEGNVVAKWGTGGLSPIELLHGASVVGVALALPLTLATDSFIDPRPPWGLPDLALILSSTIHVIVYSTYVWLIARAGATFAAQVAYLVTGFGVLWAMLLLGERFSPFVWLGMAAIMGGVFLVQPRDETSLAETPDRVKSEA